jgi:F0F1-type ATP synthase assembly protein I
MKGRRVLAAVVAATALVMTPLVLGGAYLGLYLGSTTGYSPALLAIAFSTAGFVAGFLILFRVITALAGAGAPSRG